MVWHYHDDDVPGPGAGGELTLNHLPLTSGTARLTQYRIDETHSNAYAEWKRLGAPIAPNEKQYERMQQAGQLAAIGAQEKLRIKQGKALIKVQLPRQAVSLLFLDWD
jgi:xylan 1,4-beta-xylosidase